jgi:hypothetical protein
MSGTAELLLRETHPEAECLNFALPGYSSYQGAVIAKSFLAELEPDLLVVSFGCTRLTPRFRIKLDFFLEHFIGASYRILDFDQFESAFSYSHFLEHAFLDQPILEHCRPSRGINPLGIYK